VSLSRKQIVELLRGSLLLRSLPAEMLERVAPRVRSFRCPADQLIFRKGDEGEGMMVVVSGRVKIVSVSPSGGEVLLNIIERGEVFGEMALLDGKTRAADAVAACDTELVSFYRRDFLPLLDENPEIARDLMGILCARVRQATAFVEDAVLLSAESRLLHRLKALAEQFGRPEPGTGGIRIEHGLSQQELGNSVGLTRVSVNRHLAAWRDQGLIRDGRRYIVVPDMARLESAVKEG